MEYAALTCRLLLIGIFLVSAAGKLRTRRSFTGFTEATARLGRLPARFAAPAAVAVVAAEAGTAVLLALPVLPPVRDAVRGTAPAVAVAGFVAAGALLLVFTAALTAALLRGTATPCRCFGSAAEPIAWRHVVRNLVLTACAAAGALSAAYGGAGPVSPAAAALCLLGAAVAVGAVTLLDDLAHLVR